MFLKVYIYIATHYSNIAELWNSQPHARVILSSVLLSHYLYFNPISADTVYRRQILTSKDGPQTKVI